jgi:biotin-(acetyl-CoA carboxylase) ligase
MALLKWPNDVLIGPGKVAGILLEAVAGCVIVGVGVNLASAPQLADRATVALSDFGPAPDRDGFALALSSRFAEELNHWRQLVYRLWSKGGRLRRILWARLWWCAIHGAGHRRAIFWAA